MSYGQGSVVNNVNGMREVYRGGKAALNQFMRSYAARQTETSRAMLLMAPGWVRTELGGPDARLSIEESVPNLMMFFKSKAGPVLSTWISMPCCALVAFATARAWPGFLYV